MQFLFGRHNSFRGLEPARRLAINRRGAERNLCFALVRTEYQGGDTTGESASRNQKNAKIQAKIVGVWTIWRKGEKVGTHTFNADGTGASSSGKPFKWQVSKTAPAEISQDWGQGGQTVTLKSDQLHWSNGDTATKNDK